jgi:hypothetical protein
VQQANYRDDDPALRDHQRYVALHQVQSLGAILGSKNPARIGQPDAAGESQSQVACFEASAKGAFLHRLTHGEDGEQLQS